jgi:hypothetical protein
MKWQEEEQDEEPSEDEQLQDEEQDEDEGRVLEVWQNGKNML